MPIKLTEYERGEPFKGDVDAALTALRDRLSRAQLAQIVHKQRAIIVLEGPEGGGKADVLRQLASALDPRFFSVCTILPDRRRHSEGHWLARFWAGLPEAGHSTFFYHSWYRRVLEDRVLGLVADKDWRRAYDEINEFEAQQRDYGSLVIKLYFHVTDDAQDRRIAEREADPWTSRMLGSGDLRQPDTRGVYRTAVGQMFEQNHTRWSPWSVIGANDQSSAQINALSIVADAMEKAFPSAPPADGDSLIPFRQNESA